jgi:magnesium chelatase subunit D
MSFEDRVAALGIATEFQDSCGQVFKGVDEDTDNVKTQVCLGL